MIRFLSLCLAYLVFVFTPTSQAALSLSVVVYNAYATTNATTTAYTTLVTATAIPFTTFFVCDTSGKFIKLATGAAGSEVDLIGAPVSGCVQIETGKLISVGTRISFKAMDATASTGGLMLSLSR